MWSIMLSSMTSLVGRFVDKLPSQLLTVMTQKQKNCVCIRNLSMGWGCMGSSLIKVFVILHCDWCQSLDVAGGTAIRLAERLL